MVRIDRVSAPEGFRFDLDLLCLLLVDFAVFTVSAIEGARLETAGDPGGAAPNLEPSGGDIGGLWGAEDTRGKGENVPARGGGLACFGDGFLGSSSGT